ncbi:DUF4230 domain-containing protein [Sphingomonas oligophenolica]|uniref:DUF4230 domain-containing protein n=1 Tax=Sphingomonas oligophenolica TaxID=301154 RepID=A0A502C6A7_9SPHN|nr:DUF4230 domain-containing protein [Sphingomonas oligophenolica]TPG07226.1 DUF4230 domain-containing protein [Sphingomonas oligophenolica]
MADRRLIAIVASVLVAALVVAAAVIGYRTYTERYVVKTDDGLAVAQVVQATLTGASDLKVSTLSGTVQSTASDTRGMGMFTSSRVMKAPFAVEYFVDVSGLDARDFAWDPATRTLIVNAPAVRVGAPNIDESRTYLDKTSGVFVTRGAMAALQRQASVRADRIAAAEARKPEQIAQAQANARHALAALFRGPLAAAGLDAKVVVRFASDSARDGTRWDQSTSLEEIFANRR